MESITVGLIEMINALVGDRIILLVLKLPDRFCCSLEMANFKASSIHSEMNRYVDIISVQSCSLQRHR